MRVSAPGSGASGKAAREAAFSGGGAIASKAWALFIRHRGAGLCLAILVYVAVVLAAGDALAVSSNYLVILPVAVAAFGFGAAGGLIAGALGLPANLLLFFALGHPEFSPASKVMAELSGIVVGFLFGRFADYFKDVEREMRKRMATEEALRAALAEKELLLRELHHRVKNNLSVIKGLVQLQRNRSRDPAFLAAADELTGRIFALSLVYDQLSRDQVLSMVEPSEYLSALVGNIEGALGLDDSSIGLELDSGDLAIQTEAAASLGLIVNEVLTNALKHASPSRDGKPSIRLSFRLRDGRYELVVTDDGPGPVLADSGFGLGLKLVRALARNLGGVASLDPVPGEDGPIGARFALSFPASPMEYH
jgi:two-component sensor histidine kinase